jgi:tetratricopeptide (TPR) repeat protein
VTTSSLPRLVEIYKQLLISRDTKAFVDEVAKHYTEATLVRLLGTGGREARRAAALALGYMGSFTANAPLGKAMNDADKGTRVLAENSIRHVWHRAGTEDQNRRLTELVELIAADRFAEAATLATILIEENPEFAECWNQRAIAWYRLERYRDAIQDCIEALELNPYHFGAAAGIGQCELFLGDYRAALAAFRKALELNPGLENIQANVTFLEQALDCQKPKE